MDTWSGCHDQETTDSIGRLTSQQYWDQEWTRESGSLAAASPSALRRLLEPVVGGRVRQWTSSYEQHVFWNAILSRYLPRTPGARAVEIGSAPGAFMVRLARTFGYVPYGIEYSSHGAAMNRDAFRQSGFDPDNVIQADFFSDELLAQHRGRFDVVISRGFVEHFRDVAPVIARHVELLRPGGCLVVAIPRFRGVYGAWMHLFHRECLAQHNLDIMRRAAFAAAFEDPRLEQSYCGYFGGLALYRFRFQRPARLLRLHDRVVARASQPLNALSRLCLSPPGLQSELFSPCLVYIGTRRA